MEPLAPVIDNPMFRYVQLEREGNLALYTQTHKASGVLRYEVVRIRIQAERQWPDGHVTPEHEVYPGISQWGRDGWTFYTLPAAQSHLQALREREEVPSHA